MADWNPARLSTPIAAAGVLLALGYVGAVYRFSLSFTDSASLASILGFILTVLTLATVAGAAIAVRRTLTDLSKRLILGDVVRAVGLADEVRRLCRYEQWEQASTQADALWAALARLGVSSALLREEQSVAREGALDISLVSARLRKITGGRAPRQLDGETWRSLDALTLKLVATEERLRDLGRETSDA